MTEARTRIGDVWDSTVDAARGRAGVIAPVAAIGFFLPGVAQALAQLLAPSRPGTAGVLIALIGIATLVAAVWAQLTIIGIATDPATTRAEASAAAWRRFLPAIGVSLLMGLIVTIAAVPLIGALVASGIDFRALSQAQPGTAPDLTGASTGAIMFAFFYMLALAAFLVWLGARLLLTTAVVLNERRGAGAIRRSIALTRGMTWKLLGVLILYLVVLLVAAFAVQTAAFLLIRLPLGEDGAGLATFVGAVAGGLVTATFSAVFSVFTARLYVARAGAPDKYATGPAGGDLPPAA